MIVYFYFYFENYWFKFYVFFYVFCLVTREVSICRESGEVVVGFDLVVVSMREARVDGAEIADLVGERVGRVANLVGEGLRVGSIMELDIFIRLTLWSRVFVVG